MGVLSVGKPKAVIFDVSGTIIKTGFIEHILFPYVKENVRQYVIDKWNEKEFKKDLHKLRKQSDKDGGAEGMSKIAAKDASVEEQQNSVAEYVTWCMDNKRESGALQVFRLHMWADGFRQEGKLSTPVYSDVAIKLKKWHFDDGIKFYVYSNGWKEMQKLFLANTNHGDLTPVISDYFDTELGSLTDPESYRKIVEKIGEPVEGITFLTKSGAEAAAAKEVGITPILVLTHRKNIEQLQEEHKVFPKVRSFMELEFE